MLLADIEDDKWYIRELVRRREEEAKYNRKCFPSRDNIQVGRMSSKPPAFYIHPSFEGVRQTVKDLGMPHGLDASYYLRYFNGAEFIDYHKRSFLKFKKYAVEAFGIRIKLPSDDDIFKLDMQPLPDAANYKYPPIYWYEGSFLLVQIWRLRVFKCPLAEIQVPISNPLTPNTPPVVKFEWRWHPRNDPLKLMYGPHYLFPRDPPKPLSFFKDCCRIVGDGRALGRPREFTDPDFFVQVVTDAYRRLRKPDQKPPSRGLVAVELEIDRKTFYHYLKNFKVPWPPC